MSSNPTERSQSRGREPVYSSGRGGAGNIRPASVSREHPARQQGPDDFSPARGRELADRREEVTTTGRGGAGNLRSRSREAHAVVEDALRLERQYTKEREARQLEQVYSTGRGGAGNMSRSRSRSRDPSLPSLPLPPSAPSSAVRGSFGEGRPSFELSRLEEEDKKTVEHDEHPTGRAGNHAAGHAPVQEHQHIQHDAQAYTASGRGGPGNILAATIAA